MNAKMYQLGFNGNNVYLNGETIFTVPVMSSRGSTINVVGCLKSGDNNQHTKIFVGTGKCCAGNVYVLEPHGEGGRFILTQVFALDTTVRDITPVLIKLENGCAIGGVLVAGGGCEGGGVRLISFYRQRVVEVFSEHVQEDYGYRDPFTVSAAGEMCVENHYDLNSRLEKVGVNVGESIKLLANYHSMRHPIPDPF